MSDSFVRSLVSGLFLGALALSSAEADEVVHNEVAVEIETELDLAEDAEVSETSALIAEVRSSAALFRQASMDILAGAGDRETSKARRDAANWASQISEMLIADLDELEASEERLDARMADHLDLLASVKEDLAGTKALIMAGLTEYSKEDQPAAIQESLAAFVSGNGLLSSALSDIPPVKDISIEIEFTEDLKPVFIEALTTRIAALSADSKLSLSLAETGSEAGAVITGTADAGLTVSDVRSLIAPLFEPVPFETPSPRDDDLIDFPTVSFIGVDLG